jgi:hypothetical protein
MFCGAAIAVPAGTTAVAAPAEPADCQKLGGEVSALIDTSASSPGVPGARAAFQMGIMACMEGDDAAANKHYQDAKALLGKAAPAAPFAPAKPAVAATQETAEADCQKTGSDVSALIDTSAGSPNLPGAKAVFQIGIMECMEGDKVAANKHYQDAKKLLGK